LALLLVISLIIFQIYLAIIIRYCTNTFKKLNLQVLQIVLFLAFVGYLSFFIMEAENTRDFNRGMNRLRSFQLFLLY